MLHCPSEESGSELRREDVEKHHQEGEQHQCSEGLEDHSTHDARRHTRAGPHNTLVGRCRVDVTVSAVSGGAFHYKNLEKEVSEIFKFILELFFLIGVGGAAVEPCAVPDVVEGVAPKV